MSRNVIQTHSWIPDGGVIYCNLTSRGSSPFDKVSNWNLDGPASKCWMHWVQSDLSRPYNKSSVVKAFLMGKNFWKVFLPVCWWHIFSSHFIFLSFCGLVIQLHCCYYCFGRQLSTYVWWMIPCWAWGQLWSFLVSCNCWIPLWHGMHFMPFFSCFPSVIWGTGCIAPRGFETFRPWANFYCCWTYLTYYHVGKYVKWW